MPASGRLTAFTYGHFYVEYKIYEYMKQINIMIICSIFLKICKLFI